MGGKSGRGAGARAGRIMIWVLKRLVVMIAGLLLFYAAGAAFGAQPQLQVSATVQPSGGVVISWSDPNATGNIFFNVTGTDGFSRSGFPSPLTDPNGKAGTQYTIQEADAEADTGLPSATATASTSSQVISGNGGGGDQTPVTSEQGSPMERFLAIPINAIANSIAGLVGLLPLDQLIFSSDAFLSQAAWNVAMQWYQGLTLYAVLAMSLVLLFLAWQASRAQDERERAEAYKGIWRWVFGFLMLYLVPWFATAVFTANGALVHFAYLQLHGITVDNSVATGNVLSDAIIALYMAGLKLYFNILYVVRAVFTLLLLAIAPIVIWTYVLNPTRQSFIMWGAELFSNIMMQSAHAITLSFFFAILTVIQGSAAGSGVSGILGQWWAKIVIITLVIPIGQFLRNLINMWLNVFGVPEERIAAGATAGIAGIMGLPKVLGAVSGLNFGGGAAAGLAGGGGGAGGGQGGVGTSGGGFNTPPDGGGAAAGAVGAAATAGGFTHAQNYNVAAKGAAMLGGAMGAVAGMPFKQSQTFSAAGASLGRRVVSNIGQAHHALTQKNEGDPGGSAAAIGRAAGALVAGAAGGHVGASVVQAGAQVLSGKAQEASASSTGGDTAKPGTGVGASSPVNPGLHQSPDIVPGGSAGKGAGSTDRPGGSQKATPPPRDLNGGSVAGEKISAPQPDMPPTNREAGNGLLADRPVGLEDIIDFHRL